MRGSLPMETTHPCKSPVKEAILNLEAQELPPTNSYILKKLKIIYAHRIHAPDMVAAIEHWEETVGDDIKNLVISAELPPMTKETKFTW